MKTTLALTLCNVSVLLVCYFFAVSYPFEVACYAIVIALLSIKLLSKKQHRHHQLLQSLTHGLQSLRDNDFSIGLNDKLHHQDHKIIDAFNQTSEKLRSERQHIYQREMLLDKVLNASPMVMVLVDQRGKIVFSNQQAQHTFKVSGSLNGRDWPNLVDSLAPEFKNSLSSQGESIFTLSDNNGQQQAWHVSSSSLQVHQAKHHLYLLKTITQELSKQEVATWKKVISVISHELNNSIAPISSMCHSGELLANKLDEPRLNRVFNTISGRVNHLNEFIKGYASLTKIKLPQKSEIQWPALIEQLQNLYPFTLSTDLPITPVTGDTAQLEQVLINLLKNAHEADTNGSISLGFKALPSHLSIDINDNGPGMSQEVIQNALLPFYSTKHSGTGLGLALAREIVEAHQGKLIFSNREQGGLSVSLLLPY